MSHLRKRLLALEAPEEFSGDGLRYADHGFVRDDAREARERLDAGLLFGDRDSDDTAWSLYEHAMRMIAELEGVDALGFLIEELEDALAAEDGGFSEIFHELAVAMGAPAAAALLGRFRSLETSESLRTELIRTLGGFLEVDVAREDIIAAFEDVLHGDPEQRALKAFVIAEACEQNISELVPAIRTALEANLADVSICGDPEDVEIDFGLRARRSKPRRNLVELEAELAMRSRLDRHGPVPLDADEPTVIAHALRLYSSPDGIRDTTELDAYLMTIVVSPHLLEPSVWMPTIWNPHIGAPDPAWPSMQTAERVIGAILARYNEVLDSVISQSFPPPFRDIHADAIGYRSWIAGFILGTAHWGYDYDDLGLRHQKLFDLLLGSTGDGPAEVDFSRWLAAAKAAYDARRPGPPPARGTPEWWDTEPVETIRREDPKVGRNDPCPCGSGRKFKSCCMK